MTSTTRAGFLVAGTVGLVTQSGRAAASPPAGQSAPQTDEEVREERYKPARTAAAEAALILYKGGLSKEGAKQYTLDHLKDEIQKAANDIKAGKTDKENMDKHARSIGWALMATAWAEQGHPVEYFGFEIINPKDKDPEASIRDQAQKMTRRALPIGLSGEEAWEKTARLAMSPLVKARSGDYKFTSDFLIPTVAALNEYMKAPKLPGGGDRPLDSDSKDRIADPLLEENLRQGGDAKSGFPAFVEVMNRAFDYSRVLAQGIEPYSPPRTPSAPPAPKL